MILPADIAKMLSHLRDLGIDAYVVGGAVRDHLMGKTPGDYDIAAECLPEDLIRAFEGWKSFDTGIRFGTLNVFSGSRFVEITCCRREGGYSDLRRPDSVEFCKSIREDLARRDFTVNAMAMSLEGEIIDPFGGLSDIKSGVIRAVGDPELRFREDALRIMRALRFTSTLGFEIEENTKRAIKKTGKLLLSVSGERVFTELKKLLLGKGVLLVLLEYSDEICTVIPELLPCVGFEQNNPHHIYTVYEHIARTVAACPEDVCIRLCMLLHDVAKPESYTVDEKGVGHFYGHPALSENTAKQVLERLRADRETIKRVCFLIRYHDVRPSATRKSLRKYLCKVGFDGARDLLAVRRADLSGQSPAYFDQFDYLLESERLIDTLESEGVCISISGLALNGKDLMEAGVPKGEGIGEMLSYLLEKVSREETENSRDALLSLVKKKIRK